MMFLKRGIIIGILTISLLHTTAGAAEIENVLVTDFENSIITVSGTAAEENVSVIMLKSDKTLTEGEYYADSDTTIQSVKSENGAFSVSFKFESTDGNYLLYATNSEKSYSFEFVSKETINKFIENLGNKMIAKEEIFGKLEQYGTNMGIDLSYAVSEDDKLYTAENVLLYADRIKNGNSASAVREVVSLTKAELEFMDKLRETLLHANVNSLLEEYEKSAEINLTEYNKLSNKEKISVCTAYISADYTDMKKFRDDFNKSVKAVGSGSSNSGSSSGGGGSSGGGSPSLIYPKGSQQAEEKNTAPQKDKLFEVYNDVANTSWAWDAILYSYENNIMSGDGNGRFMPDERVKREQLAKIVTVAFGFYDEAAVSDFYDAENDGWSGSYIASAKQSGLMQGVADGYFGYGKDVTREDLCVTIYRAALKAGYKFKEKNTDFTDFDSISDYAAEAVSYLAGEGIVNGTGDGRFEPRATATRAQVAKIVYKIKGE